MNIGYDAKRAYHNSTGLGYYSRTLIQLLAKQYPEHQYYLFNPKISAKFSLKGENLHEILPHGFLHTLFRSAWRSSWVKGDLKKNKIDLYHGPSHEIPMGIHTTGIKSVVTIHDLIHERFPQQYNPIDVKIYNIMGQEIYNKKSTFLDGKEVIQLDPSVASGEYIMRVKEDLVDNYLVRKIVLQK